MKRSNYAFRQCPLALFSNLRQLKNFLNCFVACVASVSVLFRSKEQGARVKDRAKNGASKRGGGWEERKETFLPLPLPPPPFIFWLSFRFSSGQNRESRSGGLSLLRNSTETLATQAKLSYCSNTSFRYEARSSVALVSSGWQQRDSPKQIKSDVCHCRMQHLS